MAVELDWEEDARPILYRTAGPFGRWLMKTFWRLRVCGLERIPAVVESDGSRLEAR